MLFVECKGTPYEVSVTRDVITAAAMMATKRDSYQDHADLTQIGYQHGKAAKLQIARCIEFYACLFLKNCKKRWPQVLQHASKFEQRAKAQWPNFHEEMQGIADGSGRELLDIVAINVRTEINFGLFSDGCTALAWHTQNRAWLAQNWDVCSTSRRTRKR